MRAILTGLMMALAPMATTQARAAELLMFDAHGCMHCELWKDVVGEYYHKTREGQAAPLRVVSLDDPMPDDLDWVEGVRYSPTFLLIEGEREIGRIVGYPGEDLFWMLMEVEFRKLNASRP